MELQESMAFCSRFSFSFLQALKVPPSEHHSRDSLIKVNTLQLSQAVLEVLR